MDKQSNSVPLSLSDKKKMLRDLYDEVRGQSPPTGTIQQQIVATFVGCFSSDPEVIVRSCEILSVLIEWDSFAALSINVFRRLFRYMPFFFQNHDDIDHEKRKTVQLLARSLERFLHKSHLIGQMVTDFPFTMLFHLVMLILEQLCNSEDQLQVSELILQSLNMVLHFPKPYGETDLRVLRKLITKSYNSIRNHSEDLVSVSCQLSKLADCLIRVFLTPNPNERYYWVEHKIGSIYATLFDLYLAEMQKRPEAVESLLTILGDLLQYELSLDLKLQIVEQLLDRGNGLTKTLKLLYRNVTVKPFPLASRLFNDGVTEVLAHYVWQFEFGTANDAFVDVKFKIRTIVDAVNWPEIMRSNFLSPFLPAHGTTASNLWLILLVSYFDAFKNEWNYDSKSFTNLVLNMTTFLNVCYLQRYTIPKFLKKYVLETIAKIHGHELFKQHEAMHKDQLRQLIAIDSTQKIFGLLPATVPRLKWFKQCELHWKAVFIRRQRVEALEERLLPPYTINASLLDFFPVELLYSVLCDSSSSIAQSNASTILSRVPLPRAILEKIASEKLTIRRGRNKWFQFLRAIFGSLSLLSGNQREQVMLLLYTKLHSKSIDLTQSVLVIDCLTQLLVAAT